MKVAGARWVKVNRWTPDAPNIRCRLVAQELPYTEQDDAFVAAPPLLSPRLLILGIAGSPSGRKLVMVMDVRFAFLYRAVKRKLCIVFLGQDPWHSYGAHLGLLRWYMPGTGDAPHVW